MYSIPDPLALLAMSLTKQQFKSLIKPKIMDFWEKKLRDEAASPTLSSLTYFKPEFYSLRHPHPIISSPGSHPFEVEKAKIQARMLSGRYRTERLRRHWTPGSAGHCRMPTCTTGVIEDLEHILVTCPHHEEPRTRSLRLWRDHLAHLPHIRHVVNHYCSSTTNELMQLILDPTVLPKMILLSQQHGRIIFNTLLFLSRTFCYNIHRNRLKSLGLM
jgi:hypothetical protein